MIVIRKNSRFSARPFGVAHKWLALMALVDGCCSMRTAIVMYMTIVCNKSGTTPDSQGDYRYWGKRFARFLRSVVRTGVVIKIEGDWLRMIPVDLPTTTIELDSGITDTVNEQFDRRIVGYVVRHLSK